MRRRGDPNGNDNGATSAEQGISQVSTIVRNAHFSKNNRSAGATCIPEISNSITARSNVSPAITQGNAIDPLPGENRQHFDPVLNSISRRMGEIGENLIPTHADGETAAASLLKEFKTANSRVYNRDSGLPCFHRVREIVERVYTESERLSANANAGLDVDNHKARTQGRERIRR